MENSGKLIEEFISEVKPQKIQERVSLFNKSGPNQQKLLDSKIKKDLADKNVDLTLAKKLFQYYVHVLTKNLSSEQRKMLSLFNVPEEPDNEVDYIKYITALNIVSASTVSLRIVKVVGSVVNGGLVFTLGKVFTIIGNFAFMESNDLGKWNTSVQNGLSKLATLLSDPLEIAQLSNDVISSRIQEYYEKSQKQNEIKLYPTSPFYSMLSKVLESSVIFIQDVISDSGILTSPTLYKSNSAVTRDVSSNNKSTILKSFISNTNESFESPFKKIKV